jgi:hypothetical protein
MNLQEDQDYVQNKALYVADLVQRSRRKCSYSLSELRIITR